MSDEKVFTFLIILAGGVIAFVIGVGGVVCILNEQYTFSEYLQDLTNVWPYLAGAIVAVLLRSFVSSRNNKNHHTDKGGTE